MANRARGVRKAIFWRAFRDADDAVAVMSDTIGLFGGGAD